MAKFVTIITDYITVSINPNNINKIYTDGDEIFIEMLDNEVRIHSYSENQAKLNYARLVEHLNNESLIVDFRRGE